MLGTPQSSARVVAVWDHPSHRFYRCNCFPYSWWSRRCLQLSLGPLPLVQPSDLGDDGEVCGGVSKPRLVRSASYRPSQAYATLSSETGSLSDWYSFDLFSQSVSQLRCHFVPVCPPVWFTRGEVVPLHFSHLCTQLMIKQGTE